MAPTSEDNTRNSLSSAPSPGDSHLDVAEGKAHPERTTRDGIPLQKYESWDAFFAALAGKEVPVDFLSERERDQTAPDRDPCSSWSE